MNYAKTLIYLGVVCFLWHQFYLSGNVDVPIEEPGQPSSVVRMSRGEAKLLDSFFREVMIPDALPYTLAGIKPLSFTCYRKPGSSFLAFTPPNLKIVRGWKVWKKYQHHFQTDRIKFWEEESPWVSGITCLIVADVGQCDRSIQQNIIDFQNILGPHTADLLKEVGEVPFFRGTLHMHEALIGILLGFGQGNAWLYYQNTRNTKALSKLPRINGSNAEAEASNYCWKYCTLQTLDISDLKLPVFVGDPNSEESAQLIQAYLVAREKLEKYYKGKDFLSATLSLYKHGSVLLEPKSSIN